MRQSLILLVFAGLAFGQASTRLVVTSAASGSMTVAPGSFATAWGAGFPAGAAVQVIDSAGASLNASIIFASPSQINFLVPAQAALGNATVNVTLNGRIASQGPAGILAVAPGLFTMPGGDVAAALAVRTIGGPSGPQTVFPVFDCSSQSVCKPLALDPGLDTPTFLELFGTGIGAHPTLAAVTATIGGQTVAVQFAGPQGQAAGLDQVNIPLPLTLRGAGLVNIIVTVDGIASNAVQVLIQ
ncbi:MAG TPA: hypothetical protein VN736_25825 [Candidatus Limnocylindrales bacterium]|nr:hypothetical protein [Candidatus Limnocylindrales bacterium]